MNPLVDENQNSLKQSQSYTLWQTLNSQHMFHTILHITTEHKEFQHTLHHCLGSKQIDTFYNSALLHSLKYSIQGFCHPLMDR